MKNLKSILAIFIMATVIASCSKDDSNGYTPTITPAPTKIYGCMDPNSANYNPKANVDDGSCKAKVYGCTDPNSLNYNPAANINDGSCTYKGKVTFWYSKSYPIGTVQIAGRVGFITEYYSQISPNCGANGCATFSLNPGTYYFYVSTSDGSHYWTNYVTVSSNGCELVHCE